MCPEFGRAGGVDLINLRSLQPTWFHSEPQMIDGELQGLVFHLLSYSLAVLHSCYSLTPRLSLKLEMFHWLCSIDCRGYTILFWLHRTWRYGGCLSFRTEHAVSPLCSIRAVRDCWNLEAELNTSWIRRGPRTHKDERGVRTFKIYFWL